MAPPPIKVRGAGRSKGIPSGFVMGRTSTGNGDVELLRLRDLRGMGVAAHTDVQAAINNLPPTGVTPGAYANADITVAADGRITTAANGSIGVIAQENGSVVDAAAATLNFTGSGVTVTQTSPGVVEVDVTGGGSGGSFSPFVGAITHKPAASDFSLTITTGFSATLTNLASRGMAIAIPSPAGSLAGAMALLNGYTPPAAGTDFSVTAMVMITAYNTGLPGICFTDSAGKIKHWGLRDNQIGGSEWNNINSVSGGVTYFTPTMCPQIFWVKVARVGTNFVYSMSYDGETYNVMNTSGTTSFLGASLASVGLFIMGPASNPYSETCYDFFHTP